MPGEVDDNRVVRRLELEVAADEDEADAGTERLRVGCEARKAAVPVAREPRVERRRGLPSVGVGAERDQLELGMRKDTIERLLTRIAGSTEDGDREHLRIMHEACIYARIPGPTRARVPAARQLRQRPRAGRRRSRTRRAPPRA